MTAVVFRLVVAVFWVSGASALEVQGQIGRLQQQQQRGWPVSADAVQATSEEIGDQCDLQTSGAICLGSKQQVLLPPSLPEGMVGYWSFDMARPVDESGNGQHGTGTMRAGPSPAGHGRSAFFKKAALQLPGGGALKLRDFTYSFWVYLFEDPDPDVQQGPFTCTLVRKGADVAAARRQPGSPELRSATSAPAIAYDRTSRRLRVELVTDAPRSGGGHDSLSEAFLSHSRLRAGRWYHVALVRLDEQRRTRLYVNGILDTSHGTQGFVQLSDAPLLVGGEAVPENGCDLGLYMDELKVYDRHVAPDELQAEASPALSGIEPSFIRLGCVDCTLDAAVQSCPARYHVCTPMDMHLAGFQVARILGWLDHHTHVWTHQEPSPAAPVGARRGAPGPFSYGSAPSLLQTGAASRPGRGLGLCCADL